MKKIFFAFVLLSLLGKVEAKFVDESVFPQWAENAIERMSEAKIMTGFGDGTFQPAKNLNRAEAVTLLVRMKNEDLSEVTGHSIFQDVSSGVWFESAVIVANEKGWIKGKREGEFIPGDFLNRAEFATIISRAFDLLEDEELENPEYRDIPSNVWYSKSIFALYKNGLIRNANVDYYYPENLVSRAEAAWVFGQILRMPRLMGTSNIMDLSNERKIDSRRTAIKPRDFNPYKQGFDIEKKELAVEANPKNEILPMKMNSDWVDMGTIRLKNTLDDRVELNTLQFKMRFERTNIGPVDNFLAKIQGGGLAEEVSFSTNGEIIFTGLTLSILSGDEKVFRLRVKPQAEKQFYGGSGKGTLSIVEVKASSIGTYKSPTATRTSAIRFAPVGIKNWGLSTIEFDPSGRR
ncbi:S-layer homology domain-containing protein [Candidatus Gracilibacteria bacterium]|nr:S-layer homology domain-containing protein [Candidatus Gracilibacteria bacterium]